jgi:pyridoxal phosphate enzyme (YggS family)
MSEHDPRTLELAVHLSEVNGRISSAAASVNRSPSEISLIVVTKTFPVADALRLYELGVRDFGENRDQEGSAKFPLLPQDSRFHFQGQIQSKKLKSIVQWARTIHSLDDPKHAQILSDLGASQEIFVQVSLDSAAGAGRGGVAPDQLNAFLSDCIARLRLNLVGLMAVAPLGEEPAMAFDRLATIHQSARSSFPQLRSLSAGMSGDFEPAIRAGATHIRVGSSILGHRTPAI